MTRLMILFIDDHSAPYGFAHKLCNTSKKHTARVVNAMWGTFDEGALRAAKGKIKFTCAVDATASSPGARIHIE